MLLLEARPGIMPCSLYILYIYIYIYSQSTIGAECGILYYNILFLYIRVYKVSTEVTKILISFTRFPLHTN